MTKDEAIKFLRELCKIPKVKVTDKGECEQLLTLFRLIEPIDQSSNQHSWTSTYQVGDTQYDVATFGGDYCETEIHRYCTWEEMGL